jgi:hypothetical protein
MEFPAGHAYADLLPLAENNFDPPRQSFKARLKETAYLEASTPSSSVKLQLLLRKEWRNPQGIEKVRGILSSLGLSPTAGGLVTISADIEPEKFKNMFGVTATETAPQPPGEREAGRSGGYISPDLKVPAALSDYVESISAAPGHIYLQK